ncbi:hypothetical protein Cpap_3410 [Ruminiclostridium papyrosolvens DSM 2782]|uniref:DUF4956 domain-containing protein n=1 Tax=Ruminiclostridium papyrosolvens DSM 2782 TaxID=588581 RepID=F1T900_9FIRM|nr:DUF4956 domain-containing protein [Ruminiclostridium papyrosolvens]EGD48982.1 hypothetical protein Cpap_3410 [Ruminiclostridium papyrosolvens DSM 2782]WES35466.1 DUF4956 domain-containing protein [Ruminiclostridium papyrosolvens DSM 2782]
MDSILNSSFIKNATAVSGFDMFLGIIVSFLIGFFIYMVYKKTFSGVMFSANFGLSLIGMAMITCAVILAVSSNVVLSLGMLGTLSIVRFRTALKDPFDIVFLFWAITSGIIVGAGMIPLAVVTSLLMGIVMTVFVNRKSRTTPYIIVINCENSNVEDGVIDLIESKSAKSTIKGKTVSKTGMELTVEVQLKDGYSKFVNDIIEIEGVVNAVMVSYNGEYMG